MGRVPSPLSSRYAARRLVLRLEEVVNMWASGPYSLPAFLGCDPEPCQVVNFDLIYENLYSAGFYMGSESYWSHHPYVGVDNHLSDLFYLPAI